MAPLAHVAHDIRTKPAVSTEAVSRRMIVSSIYSDRVVPAGPPLLVL